MNEYLMIFRSERMDGEMPSPEQMQIVKQQWQKWISGIAKSGNYSSTNRLLSEGKTIHGNVITDGPYMEGKEMIGGYLIVKAISLDEALSMAKTCPGLAMGGKVEVRTVLAIDDDPNSNQFLDPKS